MPDGPVNVTVDLNPAQYQTSLNAYRMLLETLDASVPFLLVGVRTPAAETVLLQVRHEDAYLIGFKGADAWYSFDGEPGGWGKPCGTGSNYSELGRVGNITYDDLKRLGEISGFRSGAVLDKRLVAILIAITSEAARFATVATYFTGLTNSVGTTYAPYLQGGVDFEQLKRTYFNRWVKGSSQLPKGGILLPPGRPK